MNYDVIIVGGGASGMACAVGLVDKNLKVLLVEAGERLGKKLAATGNGHGNVSNIEMTAEHYHGGNVALADKIACGNVSVYKSLFDCLFSSDENGRIYPSGRQASALVDCLKRKLNCDCVTGEKVTAINRRGEVYEVKRDGGTDKARFVVLATGGKAQKQFKTDGSAYSLATAFGHTVTPLYPSLVQIKTETAKIKTLKGIRADCEVTALIGGNPVKKTRGDVIFTEYGLSGNAIFNISSYITDERGVVISLGFLPDISAERIEKNLCERKNNGYETGELLSGTLHNQIGRVIIKSTGGDVKNIVNTLKNFELPVLGSLGFDYAQVTKGGIDMREVTDELESKLSANLFFAGEILDVDGDCGGYNLQWAFASGVTVANAILNRL